MKELEQQLQSLEAQKRALLAAQQQQRNSTAAERGTARSSLQATPMSSSAADGENEEKNAAAPPPPFSKFFRYPQYVWRHAPPREDAGAEEASRASGVADVEVSVVVDAHASARVMAPRRPGQLLKMVAGLQTLGFIVLHLNVTTAGEMVLYTLSLKVRTMNLACISLFFYDIRKHTPSLVFFIGLDATLIMSCAHPTQVRGLVRAYTTQHIAPYTS